MPFSNGILIPTNRRSIIVAFSIVNRHLIKFGWADVISGFGSTVELSSGEWHYGSSGVGLGLIGVG